VEFALIAPVLFLLVLGIIEFSRAFMVTHVLSDTARYCCRIGAIGGTTTSQIEGLATERLAGQGVWGHTTAVMINGVAGEATAASSGDELEVLISVPLATVGWLPSPRFLPVTLRGHWSMRVE
jgi:Flp pilus assembly protein TadG